MLRFPQLVKTQRTIPLEREFSKLYMIYIITGKEAMDFKGNKGDAQLEREGVHLSYKYI